VRPLLLAGRRALWGTLCLFAGCLEIREFFVIVIGRRRGFEGTEVFMIISALHEMVWPYTFFPDGLEGTLVH
jgi:hypothetical protein